MRPKRQMCQILQGLIFFTSHFLDRSFSILLKTLIIYTDKTYVTLLPKKLGKKSILSNVIFDS